jgi:Ni/Fe-hydrogenase 1 B-type cytochrome subunit
MKYVPIIYVWIDVVGFTLLAFILIGFVGGHFMGNILTGRAKKRFILGQWPAGHKRTLLRRALHFIHVFCMVGLAFSGMYIHLPFFVYGRLYLKYFHYFCAFIVGVNYLTRIWYAFLSEYADYKDFALSLKEIKAIPAVLKYYMFLADDKPHLAEFNPMQKITYTMFAVLMPLIGITGILMIFSKWLLFWVPASVGGPAAIKAVIKLTHYLINWVFIIFTIVHAYLAVTEDFPAFKYFFFDIEPEFATHHGEHEEERHEPTHYPSPPKPYIPPESH